MKAAALGLFLALLLAQVAGDCYLHNMRGSNDRLNEANTNRNNADRLFDSQNNAKGGYCWGPPMSYIEGSVLMLEWTTQHSCGHQNTDCDIILQYMCTPSNAPPQTLLRDGTTTDTIDAADRLTAMDGGQYKYGMHESAAYYSDCSTRERNKGLFHADQNLNRNDARATRQNPNGNRRGFECPEERDYYPYWHPAPWRDIAVLTSQPDIKCPMVQEHSQNVKDKGSCSKPAFNRPETCAAGGGSWTEGGSWGLEPPECLPAPWNRDNHLGNGVGGFASNYNWTLPTAADLECISSTGCNCALRARYNISSKDYEGWGNPDENLDFVNAASDGASSPVTNDPTVSVGGNDIRLAIATNQFGRTFQDRSHMFHIIPRPEGIAESTVIHNLNVRGKRGNIVQAYPAVEYDFVPQVLQVKKNELIHFQWTGCDTNPAGNDGEGQDQTDRSNLVQMVSPGSNYPLEYYVTKLIDTKADDTDIPEVFLANTDLFAYLGQTGCTPFTDNNNPNAQDPNNCMVLNKASQYFDGGVHSVNVSAGVYYFMSSRNNNFTNRSQKSVIEVSNEFSVWEIIGITVGAIVAAALVGAAGTAAWAKTHPHSKVNKLWKFN